MEEDVYRYRATVLRSRHPAMYDMVAKARTLRAKRRVMSALCRIAETIVTNGSLQPDYLNGLFDDDDHQKQTVLGVYIRKDTYPVLYNYVRAQPNRKAAEAILGVLNQAAAEYLQDSAALVTRLVEANKVETIVLAAQAGGAVEHIDVGEATRDHEVLTSALDVWADPDSWSMGGDPGDQT